MTSAKKERPLGERHAWIFRDPAMRGYFGYLARNIGSGLAGLRESLEAGRLEEAMRHAVSLDMWCSSHHLSKGRPGDWVVRPLPPASAAETGVGNVIAFRPRGGP